MTTTLAHALLDVQLSGVMQNEIKILGIVIPSLPGGATSGDYDLKQSRLLAEIKGGDLQQNRDHLQSKLSCQITAVISSKKVISEFVHSHLQF